MLNTCPQCGTYRADKLLDTTHEVITCPVCHCQFPFKFQPLLLVCGASGSGKSSLCEQLTGKVNEAVLLDGDILWRSEFNTPEDNYRAFYETWLRLGKNIGQSGRPVVLFNAGATPPNIEPCPERRYFSSVHYLALVCQEKDLIARLRQRPAWRQCDDEPFIQSQLTFNTWLKREAELGNHDLELLDTSSNSVADAAQRVSSWIKKKAMLPASGRSGAGAESA